METDAGQQSGRDVAIALCIAEVEPGGSFHLCDGMSSKVGTLCLVLRLALGFKKLPLQLGIKAGIILFLSLVPTSTRGLEKATQTGSKIGIVFEIVCLV